MNQLTVAEPLPGADVGCVGATSGGEVQLPGPAVPNNVSADGADVADGAAGAVAGDGVVVTGPATNGNGRRPAGFVTTPGRVFFNEALPEGFAFVNDVVGKRNTPIGTIVEELSANYPKNVVAQSLDRIKALGFRFAAQSGLTISINDVQTPPDKLAILDR